MVIARRTHPGDVNLPPRIGPYPVDVVIHRTGPLAGYTTIAGPARALRTPPGAPGWRALDVSPTIQDVEGSLDVWAAEIVSGTVNEVRDVLGAISPAGYTQAHVDALLAAEEARDKPRSGVLAAIKGWAEGIPA